MTSMQCRAIHEDTHGENILGKGAKKGKYQSHSDKSGSVPKLWDTADPPIARKTCGWA